MGVLAMSGPVSTERSRQIARRNNSICSKALICDPGASLDDARQGFLSEVLDVLRVAQPRAQHSPYHGG